MKGFAMISRKNDGTVKMTSQSGTSNRHRLGMSDGDVLKAYLTGHPGQERVACVEKIQELQQRDRDSRKVKRVLDDFIARFIEESRKPPLIRRI
jgi:hypothetical protein